MSSGLTDNVTNGIFVNMRYHILTGGFPPVRLNKITLLSQQRYRPDAPASLKNQMPSG